MRYTDGGDVVVEVSEFIERSTFTSMRRVRRQKYIGYRNDTIK